MDTIEQFTELDGQMQELKSKKLELAKQYYTETYPDIRVGNIVASQACIDCPVIFHLILSVDVDDSHFGYRKNIIENEFGFNIVSKYIKNDGVTKKEGHLYKFGNALKLCHVEEFEKVMKDNEVRGKSLTKANLLKLKEKLNLYFKWD